MAQTLFKATGLTAENTDTIKEAGMAVTDVKWVNINADNIVVTHEDSFDADTFTNALQAADSSVSLSK